ncbi:hypothetical protein ACFX2I_027149 [Malus domestica]
MSWKTLKHPSSRRIKKAFFVLRSSFFQDQAPTALGSTIHQFKIKPQRPLKNFHQFKIKPRRPLKKAPSFIIRSSKIKPQRPFGSTIIHLQDQAPTALEESVLRSSFFQDQAPTALWINNVDKSTHPTVLQDQAQKPLKIRSSLFFKIKPKSP